MSRCLPLVGWFLAAALYACAVHVAAQQQTGHVDTNNLREVRNGLYVIEDTTYTPAVPNVGIVIGSTAVLVVDTGINRQNGEEILRVAKKVAGGRKIYVTTTHFHPEHGFGAVAFKGQATIVYGEAQLVEFVEKRDNYVKLFTRIGMGNLVGGTEFVMPESTYADHLQLDLGGRVVDLYSGHVGHTRGDQVIYVPDLRAMFLGDLLETASFPIFPWFPDINDTDVSPAKWQATLQWAEALDPEVVVPGHGPVGTKSDIVGLSRYMVIVRNEVQAMCGTAKDVSDLQSALEPKLRQLHPDWHLSQWVGPSLNAFAKDYCPSLRAR